MKSWCDSIGGEERNRSKRKQTGGKCIKKGK